MKTTHRAAVVILAGLGLAGCGSSGGEVEAKTVLEYDQCQTLSAGLSLVTYQQVADIRGSRLIRLETTAEDPPTDSSRRSALQSANPGTQDSADGEPGTENDTRAQERTASEGTAADDAGPLLVAISRGQQPTPGYGLSLEAAHRSDATALVEVRWRTPAPDAVLAQVVTHPCLVVALPDAGFERVEARTVDGDTLGTLRLP
jgi:hypothetical protein